MYRFYREELPEKEKFIYDLMLTSFERQEIEIKVPLLDEEKIKQLFKYVLHDNPLIFYVEGLVTKKKSLSSRISLYPKYNYSKEEIERLTKACLAKAKNILEYGKNFSKYDYEILIHDLFCKKIKYHNDGKDSFNIVGALLNKRAVCSGIAKATNLLMDLKNIKSIFVEGIYKDGARTEKHAWNKVEINSNWYNLDITQDISYSNCGVVRHDCFNVADSGLINYTSFSKEKFPICCSIEENFYIKNHLIFSTEREIESYIRNMLNERFKSFSFKWAGYKENGLKWVERCLIKILKDVDEIYNYQLYHNNVNSIISIIIEK